MKRIEDVTIIILVILAVCATVLLLVRNSLAGVTLTDSRIQESLEQTASMLDTLTAAGGGTAFATEGYTTLATACYPSTTGTPQVDWSLHGKLSGANTSWVNLREDALTMGQISAADSTTGVVTANIAVWDSIRVYIYTLTNIDNLYVKHKMARE